SATDVTLLIAALRAGRVSIDEVAELFRRREWPPARRKPPATYVEMAEQMDVDVDVPGSFDEVTAAYDRGELSSDEYRVLSDAVADALNAAARRDIHSSGDDGQQG
ncbi:MAG: hypothetical protein J2P28_10120, partial [Actinobacteria bacterium]|nr:hypothetical protein [Actinomycetota bacterium]